MSENDPSTESSDQLPDLSALNFGPAWAKDKPKAKPRSRQDSQGREERGKGQRRESQGGGRQQRQGGGRDRQNRGRDDRGGQRGFRGNARRDDRGGQGGAPRRPMATAPDGVSGRIMPIEEGLDALAKDITATGRTHSVFDIAWMVLGGLERFHVIFESEEQPLYRSKKDHSLWLYQKECMAHFWATGVVSRYYDEEVVEVDPPKGNFQSVARCGLSGVLIGPPNHHGYQKNLLELHRSRFSNMALDRYKSKIVMEHGEEAVQQWLDSMTKHVRWRPKSELVAEDGQEEKSTQENVSEVSEVGEAEPVVAEVTEVAAPEVEKTVVILDSRLEVEQHFLSHGFEDEFEVGKTMSVLANVPSKMIDPGLFVLLKNTVTEERRYPGKLASILCRQMSGRHLAVFKWKKHLHCGPARPRKVSDEMVMAERPSELFHWVIANPGGNIDAMWKEILPEDVDDETKHLWYHDLHWLINEGIVLLFSDGKLHAAKELQQKSEAAKPKKSKKAKGSKKVESKEGDQVEAVEQTPEKETPDVEPETEAPKPQVEG